MRRVVRRLRPALRLVPAFLLSAPSAFAEVTPQFKQLAGPPSEMSAMAPADPAASATNSKSALLPVKLERDESGTWVWHSDIPVEGEALRFVVVSRNSNGSPATWKVRIPNPTTGRLQAVETLAAEHRATGPGKSDRGAQGYYYKLTNLPRGRMPVSVEASEPGEGYLLVEGAGPLRLRSHLAAFNQRVGQRVGLVASVYDGHVGTSGIDRDAVGTALLEVTTPDGRVHTSDMFDDGSHGDGQAGDGVYGGHFVADRAGLFRAQVVVTGRSGVEGDFIRTAEHLIPVVDEGMSLDGQAAKSAVVSDRRVAIRLGVSAPGATGHYRVIAEVWGTSATGASIPVAWIGGMTLIRDGALELGLDTRWVAMAGAREPFELRNVRVEDPKYFITVATAERMPLPMPSLAEAAFATSSITPGSITVDEEMLMGPRPPAIEAAADPSAPPLTNALIPPEYTDGSGHKLLLVHGYCSDNVWGEVKDQFDNAAIFEDFNKNRVHDDFAREILDKSRQWNSYAIVAHSQGGAAALHLYANYWSGLDNAGPGRLIQSVGTPYQGTNLSWLIAALGDLVDIDGTPLDFSCGPNWTLTYDGAAQWLPGIPAFARAKVTYYTTSGGVVPCNLLTDPALTDPEDGVTEQYWGQLPGAVNGGHKTGWCHTNKWYMLHAGQTTDESRNDQMNTFAAKFGCYKLALKHTGSGSDPVATPANSSACGAGRYVVGELVQLQASPSAGSSVESWSGANSSSTSTTNSLTIPATARTVMVNYTSTGTSQNLSVSVTGNGSVTSNSGGINCPAVLCAATYSSGALVTLTAHAGSGATFTGWGGGYCVGTGPCDVVMSVARTVTAAFSASTPGSYWLTVSKAGNGAGTVTSNVGGITCGSTCSKVYTSGTAVTLTASAASGSTFAGWSGACGGTGSCPLTMSAARSVTATCNLTSGPSGNPGQLIRQVGHNEVFWLQHGYIYHVANETIMTAMAGMPGWGWDKVTEVGSLPYIYGPAFIMSSASSNGLLIRERNTFEVYWMQNGERRWVACEAALPSVGSFADVIEVSSSIIDGVVPASGDAYGDGCPCTGYAISPGSLPSNPSSSAGSRSFDISGNPYGCSGYWTASDNGGWLTVSSTGSSLSASDKSDPLTVSWTENTSQSARSSSVTVADHYLPLTQQGAPVPTCTSFDISPQDKSAGPSAGQRSVSIVGSPSGCQGKSWTASNGSWVTVTPSSGTGPRSVTVSWTENTSPSPRQESVSIAGKTFTVSQGPANRPPVANAGLDQVVAVSTPVTLDGSGSSDPDSGPSALSYAWSQVSGPAVTLSGATTVSAGFTPPSAGTYVFELRVNDGEDQAADQVTVTAAIGVATYDAALGAPKCGSVGTVCDSGSLVVGRAGLGPEPHQPNTIHASCADGTSGGFHADESNDRIRVSTVDGTSFAGGRTVQVEATVWAWSDPATDWLEIYRAADANSPVWTLVATLTPTAAGAQTLSTTYTLPAGPLQAIRARFRWTGSAGACGAGAFDDHDDLVFAVGAPTNQGWISGRVTDAATGLPLAGIQVVAYDASGASVGNGQNNSSGFYTVSTGVLSGTYYVQTAGAGDYIDELYEGLDCPGGVCTVTRGTPISVTAGATTSSIDFPLERGGRISGTVRDAGTGTPLANVWVDIFSAATKQHVAARYTDSFGGYAFTGLPSGAYYAEAWDPGDYFAELYDDVPCPDGSCGLSGGTQIIVTAGATTAGIDFGLVRGGRIMGTVTDLASGLGLRVYVNLYDSGGAWVTSTYANPYGDYRTPVLPAGTYYALTSNTLGYVNELYDNVYCPGGTCFVTSGTPIVVTVGATRSGVDFSLARGGRISGTVTDAGTALPLSGQSVHIYDSAGNHLARLTTDSSGSYTSPGLPSANYYAKTSNTLGYFDELYSDIPCPGGSCSFTSGTPIGVTVGWTTPGVNFALTPGGRVSGRVTDVATGLPLAGVYVWVQASDYSVSTYGYTDAAGVYTTLDGLPAGDYYASTSNSLGYVDEMYDDVPCPSSTCMETDGTPITVTGGVTAGIDFALARGGKVAGTVTDASTGLPLESVWVRIYDSEGNLTSYDTTDSVGAYATETVPPGTYYLTTGNWLGYLDELYHDLPCAGTMCTVTSGTAVTVTAASTTGGIDFALVRGGRISGTLTDAATGTPLSGVQVRIHDVGGSYVTYGYTDSSGVYTTAAGLLSGTYSARTSNSVGYLNELYDNFSCIGTCPDTGGSPISVTLGSTTTGIDFSLAQGGRISGTVKDAATGLPLSGVLVRVYDSSGGYVTYGYTSSSGVYTSSVGLPSGTYRVRTSNQAGYVDEAYNDVPCPSGSCSTTTGTAIGVTAGSTTEGINFSLVKGGRISGRVTNAATGAPLAGVLVRVYDAHGAPLTSASTNASGLYTSSALPDGAYYVRTSNTQGFVDELHDEVPCPGGTCQLSDGNPVTVVLGATTGGIDFQLVVGARISGTVTDTAGSPLVGVQVKIVDAAGGDLAGGTSDGTGVYTTTTGLPSGTYYAHTWAPGYRDELYDNQLCPGGSCATTSGTPVPVTAGSTRTGVDFALAPAPLQTNDEIAGATLVSAVPYVAIEDTRTATTNPSDPVHTCATGTQDSNSVWFRYVATFTGAVKVDTFTSNYDTVLTAYPGTSSVGAELACNDDTNGGQQSEIRFDVTSGESYLVEVTDYGPPNGGTLILSVTPAPPAVTSAFATSLGQYGVTLVGWVNPRGTSTTTSFEYGLTTAYGGTVAAATLEGSTVQTVSASITGLSCATTYHFRALGANAGGTASGADVPFTTAACPLPTLSVSDATVVEGNDGSTMATFTVSLSSASSQTVTVSYTTADGSATSGSDYFTTYGPLAIPAGSLSQNVSIAVNGDHDREPDETFFIDLSSPTNATLADGQGVGTITDDDPVPTLSIGDVTARRGASGTTTAELTVTLSAVTYETVTVAYATADGTAVAGTDYESTSGEVTFPPGVTTATVSVTVNGSSTAGGRSFFVDLANPVNAGIADGRGEATLMAEGLGFYTVTPCRSVDTRNPAPGTPLAAGVPRTFAIAGSCGIPLSARAVSLNLTVTGATSNGNVRLYPGGTAMPTASTINFTAGRTRANNAVSLLGANGDLAALLSPTGTAHVVIDVNGYFE